MGEEVELAKASADVPVDVGVPAIDVCELATLVAVGVVIGALVDDATAEDVAPGFDMGS